MQPDRIGWLGMGDHAMWSEHEKRRRIVAGHQNAAALKINGNDIQGCSDLAHPVGVEIVMCRSCDHAITRTIFELYHGTGNDHVAQLLGPTAMALTVDEQQ